MGGEDNNLAEKKLKFSYFLVRHKLLSKKILIGFLISFNFVVYPILIYNFTLYLHRSKEIEKIMIELNERNIEFDVIRKATAPLAPEIISTQAISVGEGKFDLICLVYNPNRNWFIKSLNYKFVLAGGFESKVYNTFILPEEDKFLISFGEKINSRTDQLSCEILQVNWQRMAANQHKLLNISEAFSFQNIEHVTALIDNGGAISRFSFINSTVYNFWQIDFLVLLYEGDRVVGIEKTKIEKVISGEKREIKIIWLNSPPFVSRTIIKSEINFLDPSVFMSIELKPGKER